jgi:hypothetical protein
MIDVPAAPGAELSLPECRTAQPSTLALRWRSSATFAAIRATWQLADIHLAKSC